MEVWGGGDEKFEEITRKWYDPQFLRKNEIKTIMKRVGNKLKQSKTSSLKIENCSKL